MDGVPHGLCFVNYVHEGTKETDVRSFKGVGLMKQGEFHRGSALFIGGDGQRLSFSFMNHGRPHGYGKFYRADGHKSNVSSKNDLTDTAGWSYQVGDFLDGRQHGEGKACMADGRIFIGTFNQQKMQAGEMSTLQQDGTRKIHQTEYDTAKDITNQVPVHQQSPTKSEILREEENLQFCKDLIKKEQADKEIYQKSLE